MYNFVRRCFFSELASHSSSSPRARPPLLTPITRPIVKLPTITSAPIANQVYELTPLMQQYVKSFGMASSIRKNLEDLDTEQIAFVWRDAMSRLGSLANSPQPHRILLKGPRGVGKSSLLINLTEHLLMNRSTNDSILYFPSTYRWVSGYYPYHPKQLKNETISYDQPTLEQEIIKQIINLNPHLQTVTCNSLHGVLKELEGQSSKIVLLIDDVNGLFNLTGYCNTRNEYLKVEEMSVLTAIKDLMMKSTTHLIAAPSDATNYSKCTLSASTLQAEEMKVEYFGKEEMKAILEYYRSLGHILKNVNEHYLEKILFVSGGAGHNILDAIHFDTVYQHYR